MDIRTTAIFGLLILACGIFIGFSMGHARADNRFEEAYRDAETRIESLERELAGSIDRIAELREGNREAERIIAEIQRDRSQLERLVESYAKTIEQLQGANRKLRDAMLVSTRRATGIEQNVEDLERILREIDSQQ